MPVSTIREAGGRKGLSGTTQNASNAASVTFFAPKDACSKAKMAFLKQIWIIARDAEFVLMNVGPGQ